MGDGDKQTFLQVRVMSKSLHISETSPSQVMCRETIVWKQLRHDNILPFVSVDTLTIPEKYCLISPWMDNDNVLHDLEKHPDTDRLKCVRLP